MPPEPRRAIMEVPPAVHGALDFAELQRLGLHPDEVLDFSANTAPWGAPAPVRAVLADVPLDRYPDREALALRAALAEFLRAPAEQILIGNGASELIWLAALAFVRAGDCVLVVGPTYGEYARAAALMGGRITTWRAREEDHFVPDPRSVADDLERLRPRVVFVCNPNNPTGAVLDADALGVLARQHPTTLFVVDEAYLTWVPRLDSALATRSENILVLRSLTKDCGLAGLRLGYAVGPVPLVEALRRVQPPWSVNAFAQAAGLIVVQRAQFTPPSPPLLWRAQADLQSQLRSLGLSPLTSGAPFFLVRVGDGAALRNALLPRGILVRDCASFGLTAYIRISTRRPEENERLVAALREVL